MESTTTQKLVAEGLGTFVLVFFGVGTALMWSGDPLITSLAFGLSMMVMVYAVGRVSGGHFNPAISVGLALGGRIAWREVPKYAAAQVAGSILAACVLFGLKQGGPTSTRPGTSARTPSAARAAGSGGRSSCSSCC